VVRVGGAVEPLSPGVVSAGPAGLQVAVPSDEPAVPAPNLIGDLAVQLNDPLAPRLVLLRARRLRRGPRSVVVRVAATSTTAAEARGRFPIADTDTGEAERYSAVCVGGGSAEDR
jgi:hypothetical protein